MSNRWPAWLFGLFLFLIPEATVIADTTISVAADPVSTYTLVSLRSVSKDVVEIATKRDAPMTGTSYFKREINCRKKTSRLTGEGSTRDAMEGDTEDEPMEKLVEGTVPYDLAQYACANAH